MVGHGDAYIGDKCQYTGRTIPNYRSCTCDIHRYERYGYYKTNAPKRHFYSKDGDSDDESHYWEDTVDNRLYDLLGLNPPVNKKDLRTAYRKKALEYHPDKTGGDSGNFLKVKDAYDKLCQFC